MWLNRCSKPRLFVGRLTDTKRSQHYITTRGDRERRREERGGEGRVAWISPSVIDWRDEFTDMMPSCRLQRLSDWNTFDLISLDPDLTFLLSVASYCSTAIKCARVWLVSVFTCVCVCVCVLLMAVHRFVSLLWHWYGYVVGIIFYGRNCTRRRVPRTITSKEDTEARGHVISQYLTSSAVGSNAFIHKSIYHCLDLFELERSNRDVTA